MRRHRESVALLVVLLCAGAWLPVPAFALELSARLQFANDAVSARLESVPLRAVIAELARQSGAEVHWTDAGGEDTVSARFQHVATTDALRRLAPRYNFLLTYRDARLQAIWLTSTKRGAAETPATHAVAAPDAGRAQRQAARDQGSPETPLRPTVEQRRADLASDVLAEAERLALESPNVARRADAMKLLAGADGASEEGMAALERMAADQGDPEAQALARATLGQLP